VLAPLPGVIDLTEWIKHSFAMFVLDLMKEEGPVLEILCVFNKNELMKKS
jgi:hypothetical protein